MALPGDSILVTPGSGATVATESVSSKEYQVVMQADAYGHILGGRDAYCISGAAMAKGASKVFLSLWNGDAALKCDVSLVQINQELTAAGTGLVRGFRLFRCTSAPTGGTTITPVKFKNASPAVDADIVAKRDAASGTATAVGEALGIAGLGEEETGAGGAGPHIMFSELYTGEPIVLAQNEGVFVVQDATAGVGLVSACMYFRIR